MLSVGEGGESTVGEMLSVARQKVDIATLGITDMRTRRAMTGGLLLEIRGEEGSAKADQLASKLVEVVGGMGARISRPSKCVGVRIEGLDDSVTPEEVVRAVAQVGGCPVGDVKAGEISRSPTGLGRIWARCPIRAAIKAAKEGVIRVGWSRARIVILSPRPLRCYRCLGVGHSRQRCTSDVDRGGWCLKCCHPGHTVGVCRSAPRCFRCADMGRPANHWVGAEGCSPPPRERRRRGPGSQDKDPPAPPREVVSVESEGEALPPRRTGLSRRRRLRWLGEGYGEGAMDVT